ncbi:divalent metal cation transporter [Sorangium sp. So ce281]|uniref:divalent metal cation transporter n=1 Tax=unclassified Sorangium TaxID=2621164 RepID=UPI003F5E7959
MTQAASSTQDKERSVPSPGGRPNPIRRFLNVLGPGLVTGAADDDPSGVATYAQAGATFSNAMLWTVPVTLPLMMAVQEIGDRMALASGDSLGMLIRRKFRGAARATIGVLMVALVVANCLNIAADLMAIGQGAQLLGAGPAPVWSAIAGRRDGADRLPARRRRALAPYGSGDGRRRQRDRDHQL